ncbi:hypothetical protein HPB47_002495 [Ixodes persulcatus]|uniref:Uncharacterized protein n=1 Tax=Ixodes persulcatus TaxID=34615 RepID=A0AC60PL16_IXOPE|nr:hypothetical protein HPB47_002495 [Ixodes persulcatus]
MQRLSVYVGSKLLRRPGREKLLHSVKNTKRTRSVRYDVAGSSLEDVYHRELRSARVRRGAGAGEVTKKPVPELKKALTKPPPSKEATPQKAADTANNKPTSAEAPLVYGNASAVDVPASAPNVSSHDINVTLPGNASETTSEAPVLPTTLSEDDLESIVESGNVTLPPGYENRTDHHDYYNTTFYSDPATVKSLWTDLDSLPSEHVITHDMLSESHRRAATVNLTFDFPFYGHPIRNVTVATGGFLFTGYMLHVWLAATQFIAPLMANFETFTSNSSAIKYVDNGTSLIVEWHEVMLQDKPDGGNYTFQAVLHKNGDIVFVYKDLPVPVTEIPDKSHPVKVGISDAYMFDRMIFFVKRKTIYEYHQVNKKSDVIRSNTAIYFTALPTCLSLKTCAECRTAKLGFSCSWCDAVQRCSSGIDRHRQSWLENQCDLEDKKDASMCSSSAVSPMPPKPAPTANVPSTSGKPMGPSTAPSFPTSKPRGNVVEVVTSSASDTAAAPAAHSASEGDKTAASAVGSGTVVAIIMILLLVVAVGMWLLYAYRNPQTPAGQFLIKVMTPWKVSWR